ncbi:hypothetical protein NEILACOT_05146 [Neisseria lactamica ATCC 23970]|uniref:Uncharacterized protein n=1 Tax=Neisseria lactamica ATCC 23970 TaxID=546265 RepID=D0WC66_NEILA|nr:hypothetical protein NEILACOT_05146 [Neisseria lactamica ATCC 23970]
MNKRLLFVRHKPQYQVTDKQCRLNTLRSDGIYLSTGLFKP